MRREGSYGDARRTDNCLELSGIIKGGATIEACVKIDTAFGSVHLSTEGCANILSYAKVKDRHS